MVHHENSANGEVASSAEIGQVFGPLRDWLVQHGTYSPDENDGNMGYYGEYPISVYSNHQFEITLSSERLYAHLPDAAAELGVGDDGITISYCPPHALAYGTRYEVKHGQIQVGISKEATSPYSVEILFLDFLGDDEYTSDRDYEERERPVFPYSARLDRADISDDAKFALFMGHIAATHAEAQGAGLTDLTKSEQRALAAMAEHINELISPTE